MTRFWARLHCVPHQVKIVGYLVALTGIEPVYPP